MLQRKIKFYRKLLGITQKQLAIKFKVSESYISMLEKGSRTATTRLLSEMDIFFKNVSIKSDRDIQNITLEDIYEILLEISSKLSN